MVADQVRLRVGCAAFRAGRGIKPTVACLKSYASQSWKFLVWFCNSRLDNGIDIRTGQSRSLSKQSSKVKEGTRTKGFLEYQFWSMDHKLQTRSQFIKGSIKHLRIEKMSKSTFPTVCNHHSLLFKDGTLWRGQLSGVDWGIVLQGQHPFSSPILNPTLWWYFCVTVTQLWPDCRLLVCRTVSTPPPFLNLSFVSAWCSDILV